MAQQVSLVLSGQAMFFEHEIYKLLLHKVHKSHWISTCPKPRRKGLWSTAERENVKILLWSCAMFVSNFVCLLSLVPYCYIYMKVQRYKEIHLLCNFRNKTLLGHQRWPFLLFGKLSIFTLVPYISISLRVKSSFHPVTSIYLCPHFLPFWLVSLFNFPHSCLFSLYSYIYQCNYFCLD